MPNLNNLLRWGVLILISAGILLFAQRYYTWQHDRAMAAVVSKALKIAIEQVSVPYIEYLRKNGKPPKGNLELGLTGPRDPSWGEFDRVEVYANGEVHFELKRVEDSKDPPGILVWRIQPEGYVRGGEAACGARNIEKHILAWNGLTCDDKVDNPDPEALPPFMNFAVPKPVATPADEVLATVGRDDSEGLSALKTKGYDLCAPNPEGHLPIVAATRGNQTKSLPLLVSIGCDINQIEPVTGHTALMVACAGRNVEMIHYVLGSGADVNVRGPNGDTAWMLLGADSDGASAHIRELIKAKGADVNTLGAEQTSLLMRAAAGGNTLLATWLLDNGAQIDLQDSSGRTALMMATAAQRGEPVVKLLIGRGAQVNLRDAQGVTALTMAQSIQDVSRASRVMKALRAAGGTS